MTTSFDDPIPEVHPPARLKQYPRSCLLRGAIAYGRICADRTERLKPGCLGGQRKIWLRMWADSYIGNHRFGERVPLRWTVPDGR